MSTDAPTPSLAPAARIPRRSLERGLWVSILASAVSMPWVAAALGMPVTMLMECLGGSGLAVGLIVTIQQLATVAQIPAALAGERLTHRKQFWFVGALLHRALWLIPVFLMLLPEPRVPGVRIVLLVAIGLSSLLGQMGVPLWFSWMGDLIPDRMRARFWGKRQSVVMVTHLLAVIGIGHVLDVFPDPRGEGGSFVGFIIVFALAGLCGMADIIIHWFVPEPPQTPPKQGSHWFRRCLVPLRDPDFRWLTLVFGAWMFSIGLVGSFSILYLTRKFGVSYSGLSATMISASLGTAVAGVLWGSLMEPMGTRSFGTVMLLLSPLLGVVWFVMTPGEVVLPLLGVAVAKPVLILVVSNFFAGALYSGVGLTQVNMVTAISRPEGRTISMAVHWTLVGALGALGPIMGGALTDWFEANPVAWSLPMGMPFGFIHLLVLVQMLVVWLVCVPALLRVRRLRGDIPIPLLVGNPLRAAGLLMGLSALTRAAAPSRRVKALQRLGRRGHQSVVDELVGQLDDPDLDVREAAVSALGTLGTDDAVGELTRRLEDDQDELAPQLARALRTAGHPGGVDALVRRLEKPDRETQAESARALGAIGDRRAVGSLKALLKSSGDEKVVTASGEALARLGEFEAIYDMLPKMRSARRPAHRRALAVAVGDLLGRPDGFYPVLMKEEKDRGSAVGPLYRRIRRYIKRLSDDRDVRVALLQLVDAVGDAYECDDPAAVAGLLCELVSELARRAHDIEAHTPDHRVAAHLVVAAPRLGIAYWFLHDLAFWAEAAESRVDTVDMLLGIYVLSELDDGAK